jgi:hypothetical protein
MLLHEFIYDIIDPLDLREWPNRPQSIILDANEAFKAILEERYQFNKDVKDPVEKMTQVFLVRLIRRVLMDLDQIYIPRAKKISPAGKVDPDMVRMILACIKTDASGLALLTMMEDIFFPKYYEEAKKIDYKETTKTATDLFIKAFVASIEQAYLDLKTKALKCGVPLT